MVEEQTSRTLNKEVFILAALAFVTFWIFIFTKSMATREQRMEARIAKQWYESGKEARSSGKIEDAIQSFRKATVDARDNREYVLALADALAAGRHNVEAGQLLLQLRDSDPENSDINTLLARLASQSGEIPEAVHYYRNALYGRWNGTRVDERRQQLRIELIHLLLDHGKHGLAASELLLLETEIPDTSSSHLEAAKLFVAAGDFQHALKNQMAALHLDSHNAEALAEAGESYFQLGDYTKARQYLKAALDSDPKSEKARQRLTLTDMVLNQDPLAPHLTAKERQNRLLLGFNRSLQRLEACMNQMPSNQMNTEMPQLKAEALAMEPTLNEKRHPPDSDLLVSGIGVILKIQTETSAICGTPSPQDEALLLIGQEHNGGRQ